MEKLNGLEPSEVFEFFEKISSIPHGSGNTAALAVWLQEFAKERNLNAVQDKTGNVAIFKPGSNCSENVAPLMLQGHIDMVCEKTPDRDIDMANEAITLCTDGRDVWADRTTLGGDDGIAVAFMLAVLDDDEMQHPPIEALFTVDEEVGLVGAAGLEIPELSAKRMINIDSESEGILTVSCAGATRVSSKIPMAAEKITADEKNGLIAYHLTLSGMQGGHSGMDICKTRQNAAVLMGRVLTEQLLDTDFRVADIACGGRDNVIPSTCEAVLVTDISEKETFGFFIEAYLQTVKAELAVTEPDLCWKLEACELPELVLTEESSKKLAFVLYNIPDGEIVKNPEIPGMTRTSLNSGSVFLKKSEQNDASMVLQIGTMIRSNLDSEKIMLQRKLEAFMEYVGGEVSFGSDYPAWPYASESPLRDKMVRAFQIYYGHAPEVASVHAGLECGILTGKLGQMDMVSIGPDLQHVHSPKERMSVESVRRTWGYLKLVLSLLS